MSSNEARAKMFLSKMISVVPNTTSATTLVSIQAVILRRRTMVTTACTAQTSVYPPIAWTNESRAFTGWDTSANPKPAVIPIERMVTNFLRAGVRSTSMAVDAA